MEIIRTPDSQFENLKDYQFEGNYLEINDQEGGNCEFITLMNLQTLTLCYYSMENPRGVISIVT